MFKQLFLLSALTPCIFAKAIEPSNIILIEPSDSPETIIEKAANIVPTANQWQALNNEFIAFVHFGPNTFTRKEWGNGFEDPAVFALKDLDTDQWVKAMKDAGMKKVVLTVKHHDGFVMWQSRYTKHGVMSSGFRDGKGDVLKELSASCKKYGLKLGVYLSPADLYQIENPKGLYGNGSKTTLRTIPRPVEGRPFKNKKTFQFQADDYNEYFLNQLFELLTEYGPIHEVWFDGAHPKRKGNQQYNYHAWEELIRTLAPEAVIFGRSDLRWCGNEAGQTRAVERNVIPYGHDARENRPFPDRTEQLLGEREHLLKGKILMYQPAETNTSIREGWFYRDDVHQKIRSVDDVFDIYERSVGGNSIFLLNVTPNREGRLSPAEVKVLEETGKVIKQTYGTNLLKGASGEKNILDSDLKSYVELKKEPLVITTPKPITFNRLALQEAILTHSERIEGIAVDAMIDGKWEQISESANVGYKRILRFPQVTTDKIRVRLLASRATPALTNVSAHFYQSRPPRLTFHTNQDGVVSIDPVVNQFNWKPHGQKSIENLNEGLRIHYTVDGSTPTKDSPVYNAPFKSGHVMLKAVAISNNTAGAVSSEQIGLAKKDWKLHHVSSENPQHKAGNIMDANKGSYWMTQKGGKHSLAVDLGKEQELKGFAYTPQTHNAEGMMAKGRVLVSSDGKEWKQVDNFDFGNLSNDPSKRYHHFKQAVNARYLKLEVTAVEKNGDVVTMAELDVF